MANQYFLENFLVLRRLHPRVSHARKSRLEIESPESSLELEYRDLLTEANESYFQREYTIALSKYLELRHQIFLQSHPEMPPVPGGSGLGLLD